jgi:hypothetical protein
VTATIGEAFDVSRKLLEVMVEVLEVEAKRFLVRRKKRIT